MHEIICPHCSKAFKIDEAGYANPTMAAKFAELPGTITPAETE
ncbi:MAG: hypothetical protein ABIP34_20405 [Rhodoferax sp.]